MDFPRYDDETRTMGSAGEGLIWHPLFLHLPLVLALLIPLVTAFLWSMERREPVGPYTWRLVAVLTLLFTASSTVARIVALKEYRRIAPLISDDALEAMDHFLAGYTHMAILASVLFVLAMLFLNLRKQFRWLTTVFFIATIYTAYLSIPLARLGGELVYVHRVSEVGL